jgi:hypothetical protein
MILKRVNKIFKLTVLILARQIWGLLCTLYLLTYQPYLTLKDLLVVNRDKSQIALLTGTAMLPAVIYVILRLGYDYFKYNRVLPSVGSVFASVFVIEVIIWMYLGFWIIKVYRSKEK